MRFFVFFYLPYLSSIYEKANCATMFCAHSLGSCHFQGVWATCLPHKSGGVPLSALPKDPSELSGLFSTTSHKCRAPSRKAMNIIFICGYQVYRLRSARSNHYAIASLINHISKSFTSIELLIDFKCVKFARGDSPQCKF